MAPEPRVAASFAEAQALGLPLSSKGHAHAPSIGHRQACSTCRRRKLRCDGAKPLCGVCSKSTMAHGDDLSAVAHCVYLDPAVPKKQRAQPPGHAKVAALEAEIGASLSYFLPELPKRADLVLPSSTAELKALVAEIRLTSPSSRPTAAPTPAPFPGPAPPYVAPGPAAAHEQGRVAGTSSGATSSVLPFATLPLETTPAPSTSESWLLYSAPVPEPSPPTTERSSSFTTSPSAFPPQDPLLELLYPGWPRDLPPPDLTYRLVEVYFARPHQCAGVVNAARVRAALRLSPTSAGFPHPALLHVMCAIAGLLVPDDFFRGETYYWRGYPRAADYHIARCKLALDGNLEIGSLFDGAQITALLCFWLYSQARWVDLWLYCGQATRLTTPLGLNHVRAASDVAPQEPAHYEEYLVPSTDDDAILRERALTFFLAFTADRFASASTGWACSIDKVDISTVIPSEVQPYPRGPAAASCPNSVHHPAFFTSHVPGDGPLQLMLKAIVLLGEVVQYQQRAPHANKLRAGFSRLDRLRDQRSTQSFHDLDSTIYGFLSAIPREYQFRHRPLGTGVGDVLSETRLHLVHGIAHTSWILLHEPYVSTLDEDEPSLVRCVESANEILQGVFLILGTSYDVALLSPFFTYIIACAGRTFVRQIAIKLVKGVRYGVEELKSNIETILVVLKAHRTPLGDNAHATLSAMLAEPLRCLPRPFLGLASQPLDSHPPPSGPSSHVPPIPWQARFNGVGGASSSSSACALAVDSHAPLLDLGIDLALEQGLSDPATFLRELDAAATELAPAPPLVGVALPLDGYDLGSAQAGASASAPLAPVDAASLVFGALEQGSSGAVEWQTLQGTMGIDDLLYS
ncbi:hypothetical protein JCM9279_003462 [Rhodotorula babjevae]